jgi:CotH kinase protein
MKRYIERNFNGNMKGNLYEIEHTDDFVAKRLSFIGVESLSEFDDKADLKFAANHIAANGIAAVNQLFDVEQFIKFYAMEFYLKHWDGYADNTNNTYVYNDVTAVANPGAGAIKFKMIPWGIDQAWLPGRPFRLGRDGIVAKLIRADPARRAQLFDQIRKYRETVFAREIQQTKWTPLINAMQALLGGFGVPDLAARVGEVRHQVRLAESAGYLAAGLPADNIVYLLNEASQALHASNTESMPVGVTPAVNFEVYHWPLRDDNDKADLWHIQNLGTGKSVTNVAFDRNLHATNTFVSSDGHKLLYTCPTLNTEKSEEFSLDKVDSPGDFTFSGYCRLVSNRTNLGATYGGDLTPGGRARVHQEGPGSNVYLY